MAKKGKESPAIFGPGDQTLIECIRHYTQWTTDNEKRRTRPNGWDAVTDAYWGKLPNDWPYNSRVVDPRIRTSVVEKRARLLNQKLRGRLVPRPDGDASNVIKARINNALLDFQWDNANDGGTMLSKWGQMDQDTRLYSSDFGLVKWRHVKDKDGKVLYDGNEFYQLDVRNCGVDPTFTHIRDAKWFQHRGWEKMEDLENVSDLPDGSKVYPGLADLKSKIAINSNDRRDTAFPNRVLQNKGLVDRVGEDRSFPVIEIVTEYRADRWITFAPKYRVILRDIPNPYKHGKIPVVQLRYFKLTGDGWGESEVEPVLPIWKAIQATICGFIDNMNIHNRPPLKILDGQVRIETIVFGPEAQWMMDRPDSVTEFQGSDAAIQYFQTSYQSLISAFNTAMGDLSQGVSQTDPLKSKGDPTTATEINYTAHQQNTRDQDNQTQLAEAIEDMMLMWVSNNQQFIFADPDKQNYMLKIVGSDLYNYFQRVGMDQQELTPEAMQTIGDVIHQQGGNMSDEDLNQLVQSGMTPKYPVFDNPKEKNPSKLKYKPKMSMNETNDGADLIIVPEDLEGIYSYVADVKSMSTGAGQQTQQAREAFLTRLTTNPIIMQLLQAQGVQPDIKELLITDAENAGLSDAERYFPSANTLGAQQGAPQQAGQGNMPPQALPNPGIPAGTPPGPQGGQPNPMAQPNGPQLPTQLQPGLQQGAGL